MYSFSIVGSELELVEVGETQIEGLHPFNDEEGVGRTHHVLEKAFGGIENLHGCMLGLGWVCVHLSTLFSNFARGMHANFNP